MAVTGAADECQVAQMVQVVSGLAEFCRKNGITDGSVGMRGLIDWIASAQISGDPYTSALDTVISKAAVDEEDREALITAVLEPVFAPAGRLEEVDHGTGKSQKGQAADPREAGKITDQEFFTSRLLAIHLEDLAAAQTRRYGVNRRVRVCLVWQPDRDDLAFTDNLTITLNPGHPAITQFPTRGERYQMVCGLFAHELGHCLYTDFLAQQTYRNSLANGRWYRAPGALSYPGRKNRAGALGVRPKEPENLVLLGAWPLGSATCWRTPSWRTKCWKNFPALWAKPWALSGRGSGGRCPRSPS